AETVFLESRPFVEWALPIAATLASVGSVAVSLRFSVDVVFGSPARDQLPRAPHEPPKWMRVPVELLVLTCVVVGVAPAQSVGPLLEAASRPVVGGTLPEYSLAVWHGFNLPFVMSLVALGGGAAAYRLLRRYDPKYRLDHAPGLGWADGKRAFDAVFARLTLAGRWTLRRVMSAGLQAQLLWMLLVTIGLAALALRHGVGPGDRPTVPLAPTFALLWLVGGGAAACAAWQAKYERLAAVMLAGVAGIATCITFIWFSAPDLALTQLVVESVTTMLILLGLRWLPRREPRRGVYDAGTLRRARLRRARDLAIALAAGGGMATIAYAVATRNFPEGPSLYFLEHALTEGGGRNVVNVILVDFRGFDTFGEGVVLSIVALTVYALLRRFRPAKETMALPPQQRAVPPDLATDLLNPRHVRDPAVGYLMVPAVLVRLLLPVTGVVAVYFFLRGHNAPGGGFVAGLVLSIGFLLQYLVSGTEWVEEHLRLAPRGLIAVGLLLALGTGVGAFAADRAFLTSHGWHATLPIVGEIHLPSATFFDLGVFSLVLGSTLFILTALAHQSVRAHREAEKE
ncbi:MAG TPA: hydrogen gas-evolving membrane-bound hydrogenase subunit E, partial [Anaeromyxobacteraceae bacterium]|nr:hydrogen gas-evolving membrane-bound hydrogenase subunit E [Anaeromyxobacteraceae bacterium]